MDIKGQGSDLPSAIKRENILDFKLKHWKLQEDVGVQQVMETQIPHADDP